MANGGIIGPVNIISVGGNTITTKTSSTPSAVTTQPGTRLVQTLIVAGGGAGGAGPLLRGPDCAGEGAIQHGGRSEQLDHGIRG